MRARTDETDVVMLKVLKRVAVAISYEGVEPSTPIGAVNDVIASSGNSSINLLELKDRFLYLLTFFNDID